MSSLIFWRLSAFAPAHIICCRWKCWTAGGFCKIWQRGAIHPWRYGCSGGCCFCFAYCVQRPGAVPRWNGVPVLLRFWRQLILRCRNGGQNALSGIKKDHQQVRRAAALRAFCLAASHILRKICTFLCFQIRPRAINGSRKKNISNCFLMQNRV